LSRNTQYQFVPTNPEDVETELIALYEAIFGTTVQPASPERLFIQYVAAAIIQERVINNYTGNQNIPSRAEGENLDALAELTYSKKRPEAKAATCTMRFSLSEAQKSAVLIPAGTRITDASKTLVWETREDNYVPIGETHIDVENVTCQTTGTAGNGYTPGQINKLVDVYDFYTSCENITTSAGGSDAPDDDEYYELMRSSMDAYSTAGATGSYIYWAKQESTEIKDVAAVSPTPGVVKIYVLMEDGKLAGEELKNKVLAACSADERRPLTDWVSVEDAELVPYEIAFTYYTQTDAGISAADLSAAVEKTVEDFISWQCGKLGRDINPSHLIGELMKTGVKRVELTAPAFTKLNDGSGKTVPQLATLQGTPTIINGGYENE
jgi:phage-related baseplate assembly protein